MPLRAYGWLQRRGFLLPRRTVARFGGRIHQTMMGLIRGDCPLLWLLEQKAETRWLRAAVQLPSFLLLFLPFFYQRHALDLMLGISTIKKSSSKEAAQKKHSAKVPDQKGRRATMDPQVQMTEQLEIVTQSSCSKHRTQRQAALRGGNFAERFRRTESFAKFEKDKRPAFIQRDTFLQIAHSAGKLFLVTIFLCLMQLFPTCSKYSPYCSVFLSEEGETAREKYRMSRKVISTSQLLFDSQNFFIQIKQTHNRHPPALSFPETNTQD